MYDAFLTNTRIEAGSPSLKRGASAKVTNLLAAMVSVGLLGMLGTGGLVRGNHGADAQTVSRPNLVVAMIDLDKQSMGRSKRGEDGKSSNFEALVAAGILVIVAS